MDTSVCVCFLMNTNGHKQTQKGLRSHGFPSPILLQSWQGIHRQKTKLKSCCCQAQWCLIKSIQRSSLPSKQNAIDLGFGEIEKAQLEEKQARLLNNYTKDNCKFLTMTVWNQWHLCWCPDKVWSYLLCIHVSDFLLWFQFIFYPKITNLLSKHLLVSW